jgi:hypothetical protein
MELTGQVEVAARSAATPKPVGGFHTDWLNMMLPPD